MNPAAAANRALLSPVVLLLCALASLSARCSEPALGPPMEVTVNNHGDLTLDQLRQCKDAGATSVQRYIIWKDIEKAPGVYDWSAYDAELGLVREAGLKWVPFVIAGPYYVTPDFVRDDPKITFFQCLEHGKKDAIPSLWCPRFPSYVEGWLKAFAAHYAHTGLLESVELGITGGYGEAIYPADGGFWPATMHMHIGLWAGDEHAVQDFRHTCREAYENDLDRLNKDWGTYYPSFDVLRPFTRDYAPSPKAWLSLVAWYRDAMTRYADWWLGTAKKYFGDTPLYLCTGGNMTVGHGTDFSAQAKAAARHGAGIRITNENVWLPKNVFLTRMIASAAHFYGAFYGTEPASYESAAGTVGRIFNLYTSGARQLFTYGMQDKGRREAFVRHRTFLTQQRAKNEVAAFFPVSTYALEYHYGDRDRTFFYRLRERVDYDFVDERMVCDGALDAYAVVLVYEANCAPAPVIQRLHDWVHAGGILLSINARLGDYAGDTRVWDAAAGLTEASDVVLFGHGQEVLEPEVLPSLEDLGGEARNGMSFLQPECRVLMQMTPEPAGKLSWIYPCGQGWTIAYQGPPNTAADPGLPRREGEPVIPTAFLRTKPSLPVLFLKDILTYLPKAGLLDPVPASLWTGNNAVFLSGLANGDLAAVNVGKKTESVEWQGKAYPLPPETIIQIPRR